MSDDYVRVSTILKIIDNSYQDIPETVMEIARQRGTDLHGLSLQYFASTLGLAEPPLVVPDMYQQAYEGVLRWAHDEQFRAHLVEQRGYNHTFRYRGDPDIYGTIGASQKTVLVDLKFTAQMMPIAKVQVRAYHELEGYTHAEKMMVLHVPWETGKYRQHWVYKNGGEWGTFFNGLSIYQWRTQT